MLRSPSARRFLESVTAGVFRSTGDGLESPAQLPNLATWYDASDKNSMRNDAGAVPASGDSIKLWADKSGNSAVNCLVLNGVNGNYASAPNAAPLQITGDQTLIVGVNADSYAPAASQALIGKWNATGEQRGIALSIEATTGNLLLVQSTAGTAATVVSFTSTATLASVGITALTPRWLAATLDVDNGAAGRSAKFYYAAFTSTTPPAFPAGWTQLGATVTVATAANTFNSSAELGIGAIAAGTVWPLAARVFYADVRNGYDGAGSTVFSVDFSSYAKLATSVTAATGQTVTINTSGATGARISGARDRYWGGLAATMPVLTIAATGNILTGNGTSTSMKSAPFSLPQPVTRATVLSQKSWTAGDVLLDGNSANSGAVVQTTGTPQINLNAGSSVAGNTGLALNTRAVLIQTINGASSALRVNRGTPTTGNAGATAPNGGTAFSDGAGANFADMTLCEDITYSVDLPTSAEDRLALYLGRKWGVAV